MQNTNTKHVESLEYVSMLKIALVIGNM